MDGILLIDKLAGWTSHDVCQFIKKRFRVKKVGHTGTLDPQATGVLVLMLGAMTKRAQQLVNYDKEYTGTIEIGTTTSTQDGEGDVLEEKDWHEVTPDDVRAVIEQFKGPQKQVPPMVSAIRSGGVRLYTLARQGKEVKREARDIIIYEMTCNAITLPLIDFTVTVSKGTYVRTIAHDIGVKLGTGAHLKNLRRIRNGSFHIDECVSIDDLKKLENKNDLVQLLTTDKSKNEIET